MSAERTLPDQQVRDRIASDLQTNFLVEAAAGTGKTTSMVKRMVSLVREGVIDAGEMAAITFTIKAGAHLREKFQERLEEELKTAQGAAEARLRAARRDIEQAFIGTIHAFCARLLRERPVEAGLDPGFEELTEGDAARLPGEFWERYTQRLFVSDSSVLRQLAEVGVQPRDLAGSFAILSGYGDVVLPAEKLPRPDLTATCESVVEFLERAMNELSPMPEDEPFAKLLVKAHRFSTRMDFSADLDLVKLLERVDGDGSVTQKNWPDKQKAKAFSVEHKALRDNVVKPALRAWREYVYPILIGILQPAIEEFTAERRRTGKLTFQDLLLSARDLLRDHAAVRRYFRKRFKRLLVDEFQDTDPIQAEIIFYLTSPPDAAVRSWKELRPEPGSLFIVGDPKQSIYRFRRADIALYQQVKAMLVRSGGEVLKLTTNFRSVPGICEWVNDHFRNVFTPQAEATGRQAGHVDVTPQRDDVEGGGVYRLETVGGTGVAIDGMIEAEAESIAGWIASAVAGGRAVKLDGESRPARYSDFLLIARDTTRLSLYAQALEKHGVPYEVTGGRAFAQSEELRMLLPFLRAVVEPDDAFSIVAHLRGPLCGVDDQALYDFSRAGGRFSYFADLPPAVDERITKALRLMREAHETSRTLPPAAVLGRILGGLGLLAAAATGAHSGTRSGNLLKALSLARKLSADGETFPEVVAWIASVVESAGEKIEEMHVQPVREDVVRLMNLHQAKGLEAPFVFLIDPRPRKEFPLTQHVDRQTDPPAGHFMLEVSWGRGSRTLAQPLDWEAKALVERDFERREEERLLYVAATRAQNAVIVGLMMKQLTREVKVVGCWSVFAPSATTVLPPLSPAATQASNDLHQAPSVEEFRHELSIAQEEASRPRYSVLPITKIAHANHAELTKAEEGLGRGTSWGRVLHRLFEAMLREPAVDVELYAANLLKDEERDAAELSEVLRVVRAVESSDVWSRAKRSKRRFVEVPFAITVPSADFQLDGPEKTLLHGIIDLVFFDEGRWHVVDYKSDSTKDRLESLVAYYRPQVEHYARFWKKLTGEATRGGLFFVDSAQMAWID